MSDRVSTSAFVAPTRGSQRRAHAAYLGVERAQPERAQSTDRIFGAPSFVLGDQLFWGHDRMHHLRRALIEARGAA